MSTSLETEDIQNNKKDNELNQNIKAEQDKEISYIMEASQADDKRTKFLAKKNEYKIMFDDGHDETFKRKPLSSKKNKEIDDLRTAFASNRFNDVATKNNKIKVNNEEFNNTNDVLYEAFKRTAQYCLGLNSDQFDNAIWEDDEEYIKKGIYGLRSVLAGCLMRAVHGIAYFQQP